MLSSQALNVRRNLGESLVSIIHCSSNMEKFPFDSAVRGHHVYKQCFQQDLAPAGAPAGTLLRIASCIPAFSTRGKGALGPLLTAPAGASKRETPTSNLTESTDKVVWKPTIGEKLQAHQEPRAW